jgi:[NiFe]-hydrogenase assembly, chaperone, HybE
MADMFGWQLSAVAAGAKVDVVRAVEERFRHIHEAVFAGAMDCNPALPVQLRAMRRVEDWWVFLLLTPWMMSRLFLPRRQPGLPLPPAWMAEDRREEPYVVIGPAVELVLQSGTQRAHINYDVALGHYLIQPLAQAMEEYACADQVFSAWNEVIATRDRVMVEQQRDCPWQKEVSRREWFARMLGRER